MAGVDLDLIGVEVLENAVGTVVEDAEAPKQVRDAVGSFVGTLGAILVAIVFVLGLLAWAKPKIVASLETLFANRAETVAEVVAPRVVEAARTGAGVGIAEVVAVNAQGSPARVNGGLEAFLRMLPFPAWVALEVRDEQGRTVDVVMQIVNAAYELAYGVLNALYAGRSHRDVYEAPEAEAYLRNDLLLLMTGGTIVFREPVGVPLGKTAADAPHAGEWRWFMKTRYDDPKGRFRAIIGMELPSFEDAKTREEVEEAMRASVAAMEGPVRVVPGLEGLVSGERGDGGDAGDAPGSVV